MQSLRFLKVPFNPLPLDKAVAVIAERAAAMAPFAYVVTPNAQDIVRYNQAWSPAANAAADAAWLSFNDSGPAQFLARTLFGVRLERVPGSDLTQALLDRAITPSTPITLLGGSDALEATLRDTFGFKHLTRMNPAMGLLDNPAEIERSARFVIANPAPYIFLVVGTPQAAVVAHRVVQLGGGKGVGLCVGSALNFAAGLSPRAPAWMRDAGLEWLHRLVLNPRTHARRVFVQSFPLMWFALTARLAKSRA